jgi:NADH-quinone oxidoreductase subunit E
MSADKVRSIIDKWNNDPTYVIEMLQEVQSEFRHVPQEALAVISDVTGVPPSRIFHIVTFYNYFSLKPRGEHRIQVCRGTACHVKGAPRIMKAINNKLALKEGETTEDLKYSLETVRCLGCCSIAPVVALNEDVIGNANSATIDKLILKKGGNGGDE